MLLLGSSKHKSEMYKPILWVYHTAFEVDFLHFSEMLKVPRRQERELNTSIFGGFYYFFSIQNSGTWSWSFFFKENA